jgi:hypothetical protein
MSDPQGSGSWWKTLPGILTATAGIITAVTGLIVALNQVGVLDRVKSPEPKSTIEQSPGEKSFTVSLGQDEYIPPHIQGDADFFAWDDKKMQVDVVVTTRINNDAVDANIWMDAQELGGDRTQAKGETGWKEIYKAPPGWSIASVTPIGSTKVQAFFDQHQGQRVVRKPNTEVVHKIETFGDRRSPPQEAGIWTRAVVHFTDITVTLRKKDKL